MEIGTTIISTDEYVRLRAMKDNLEAMKAEIEANADKVIWTQGAVFSDCGLAFSNPTTEYIGKDEAMLTLSKNATDMERERDEASRRIESQKLRILSMERRLIDPDKINRSPRGRLHFLFTGELFKTKW